MSPFTLEDPIFRTYMIAASLAILKMVGHSYLTVYRMMSIRAGFVNPEDTRRTLLNPTPHAAQTEPNDYVERTRRLHRNELENTPPFLAAGLLFVAAGPGPVLAATLLYGYVAARFAHTWAYLTAQDHEVRATFFTIGSLLTAAMAAYALWAVAGAL